MSVRAMISPGSKAEQNSADRGEPQKNRVRTTRRRQELKEKKECWQRIMSRRSSTWLGFGNKEQETQTADQKDLYSFPGESLSEVLIWDGNGENKEK